MSGITPSNAGIRAPHGTIGNAIRALREKNGLTQVRLADKIKRTQSTIASYESGRIAPSLMTVRRLATELNVPVEFLLAHKRSLFSKDQYVGLIERKNHECNQDSGEVEV